ncbi:MAG TPA: hypothetical protein VKE40_28290 [Gemmataceae bacterium]|nr:hypothetical protein [Gemmataceae bacterium]
MRHAWVTSPAVPDRRAQGPLRHVGRHNAESFVIASTLGAILWTDDAVVGMLGETDFGVRRMWTQAVLHRRVQDGTLTHEEYDRATALLVGWNYRGIEWNARTSVAAAVLADWNLTRWPVPQVLRHLRGPGLRRSEALRVASESLLGVWGQDVSPLHRQAFVFAVCNGLQSAAIVRRLRRLVEHAFGLDQEAATEVVVCIDHWLRHPTGMMTL